MTTTATTTMPNPPGADTAAPPAEQAAQPQTQVQSAPPVAHQAAPPAVAQPPAQQAPVQQAPAQNGAVTWNDTTQTVVAQTVTQPTPDQLANHLAQTQMPQTQMPQTQMPQTVAVNGQTAPVLADGHTTTNMAEAFADPLTQQKSLFWKATAISTEVFQIQSLKKKTKGQYAASGGRHWYELKAVRVNDGSDFLIETKSATVDNVFREVQAALGITDVTGVVWQLEVWQPSAKNSLTPPGLTLTAWTPDGRQASAQSNPDS